jgi:outer membrane scaffolding protein for murein synthesis (MipA/OmpV family)
VIKSLIAFRTFVVVLCCYSSLAYAADEDLPLWELGVGFGGFSTPQYMGSDERYTLPFAFPFPIYRGKRWWLDRAGLRGRLFSSEHLSLDLSLSGGLPVKNSNKARQGMPRLHLTGEIGPRLNWIFYRQQGHDLRLMLPWRAAVNTKGKFVGALGEPELQYIYQAPMNDGYLRWKLGLGALHASQRYNDTYYGVAAAYATANRPVYQARSGLHSLFARVSLRYPLTHEWQLFLSSRVRSLASGVVKDSPLVRQNSYTTIAAGAIWMFSHAEETAAGEE